MKPWILFRLQTTVFVSLSSELVSVFSRLSSLTAFKAWAKCLSSLQIINWRLQWEYDSADVCRKLTFICSRRAKKWLSKKYLPTKRSSIENWGWHSTDKHIFEGYPSVSPLQDWASVLGRDILCWRETVLCPLNDHWRTVYVGLSLYGCSISPICCADQ